MVVHVDLSEYRLASILDLNALRESRGDGGMGVVIDQPGELMMEREGKIVEDRRRGFALSVLDDLDRRKRVHDDVELLNPLLALPCVRS